MSMLGRPRRAIDAIRIRLATRRSTVEQGAALVLIACLVSALSYVAWRQGDGEPMPLIGALPSASPGSGAGTPDGQLGVLVPVAAVLALLFIAWRLVRRARGRAAPAPGRTVTLLAREDTSGSDRPPGPATVIESAPAAGPRHVPCADRVLVSTAPPATSGGVACREQVSDVATPTGRHAAPVRNIPALEEIESSRVVLFDRRAQQRVVFVSEARLRWDDRDLGVTTLDLSTGGVLCQLPSCADGRPAADLVSGAPVRVSLPAGGVTLDISARVGWQRPQGSGHVVGVQFLALPEDQLALLQAAIVQAGGSSSAD